jgi:hypothetical protein
MQRQLIEVIDSLTFNSSELPALKAMANFVVKCAEQRLTTTTCSDEVASIAVNIKRVMGNYSRSVIGVTNESND